MKYYLHTVVHHAGEWQVYLLDEYDMCLGMSENSAFEKRHYLGRMAFQKGLKGVLFADRAHPNPSIHATMRNLLRHQHGLDLVSLNEARYKVGLPYVGSFGEVHDENSFDEACQEISEVFDAEERAAQAALAEAAQVEHRMSLEQTNDDEFSWLHQQRNSMIQRAP